MSNEVMESAAAGGGSAPAAAPSAAASSTTAPPVDPEPASLRTRHRHGGGGWLRLLLPLSALGLVVAVFFFTTRGSDRSPLQLVEGVAIGAGMEVSKPRFMGESEDGSPFRVAAEKARPDSPDPKRIELDVVEGEMALPGGRRLTANAAEGVFRPKESTLELGGGFVAVTDDGYRMTTDGMSLDMGARSGRATSAVSIEGPLGRISADRMEAEAMEGLVVRFEGEVKVVIESMTAPNDDAQERRRAAREAGVPEAPTRRTAPTE